MEGELAVKIATGRRSSICHLRWDKCSKDDHRDLPATDALALSEFSGWGRAARRRGRGFPAGVVVSIREA
jgi:hypothetical protein